MKSSFKSLVILLGAALITLPVLRAQDGPPAGGPGGGPEARHERREKMGDRMAQELGLSDDQKAKIKEIDQQEKAELEALRNNTAVAKEDKRAQVDAIRKNYMEKRQAIMTPEQREKAKAMREKMGKRREGGEGHPERHGPPPGDAAK
jgi:Spy/CpxP family protein refolding chaperone